MTTEQLAVTLIKQLQGKGMRLATAESCTGGGIGHILTGVSGCSAVYLGGVISYQNEIKERLLHVPSSTLAAYSAVSSQTAEAMVKGCMELFHADLALSVTGLAGPNSDDSGKPVGLVYIGASTDLETRVIENHFHGSREDIRNQAIDAALELALEML